MTIEDDLIRDEALKLKPYKDTKGKLTIGIGRNLTDVGITEAEARQLLDNDLSAARSMLDARLPWWRQQTEPRQRALLNMCFNMGWEKLSGFKQMIAAIHAGDYETAAAEALASDWADQVHDRAKRIALLLRDG